MKEIIEARFPHNWLTRVLQEDQPLTSDSDTRRIILELGDPRIELIQSALRESSRRMEAVGYSAIVKRKYSAKEILAAQVVVLVPTKVFEPAGEECGTIYSEKDSCNLCGFGRRRASALALDTRRLLKDNGLAQSIAGETIVSTSVARLFLEENLTGCSFGEVYRCGEKTELDMSWKSLDIDGDRVAVSSSTRFGIDPLSPDLSDRFRCPLGHVAGLNRLSELRLSAASWTGADFSLTSTATGRRSGLLAPMQTILVSPRVARLLLGAKFKGFSLEVAHLCSE